MGLEVTVTVSAAVDKETLQSDKSDPYRKDRLSKNRMRT